MVALRELPRLTDDLDRLAGALEGLSLGPDLSTQSAERDRLARTIRQYLIPRAMDPTKPVTVVFAGPTGSGKSTLINSLTGHDLSAAGPLRPTTTTPLVLAYPDRVREFESIAGIECDVVAGAAPVLDTMALVDTPDIDSTSTHHRQISETLIDNADVVVFVTSALRYADAVPWQVLRRAQARGTDVIQVLNRVGSATRGAVVDFKSRLVASGFSDDVVTVPEHHLPPGAQQVPSLAVRSLRKKLATLAGDRAGTAGRAFAKVLRNTVRQVNDLDDELTAVHDQLESKAAIVSVDLAGRVASLDLTEVGQSLLPPAPAADTPRAVRRWRRSARRVVLGPSEVAQVVSAIEGVVHRDLRLWLTKQSGDGLEAKLDPRPILTVVLPVLRLAMEGWIDFVRRIADEAGRRDAGLVEAVLATTATNPNDMNAARIVFGDKSGEMTHRARRELVGRLEVVYEQAGAQVIELLETRLGVPDLTLLRASLGAVSSALAHVDA